MVSHDPAHLPNDTATRRFLPLLARHEWGEGWGAIELSLVFSRHQRVLNLNLNLQTLRAVRRPLQSRIVWSACVFSAAFPMQTAGSWPVRFMERESLHGFVTVHRDHATSDGLFRL